MLAKTKLLTVIAPKQIHVCSKTIRELLNSIVKAKLIVVD